MKPNTIPAMLFVFLTTALIVSCHKEGALVSSSTINGSPTPPPTNNLYSDLSAVSDTDQIFYFLQPSTYTTGCVNTYCTQRSRYILHSDGSFLLQYNYDRGEEYRKGIQYNGWYTQKDQAISLTWAGWSVAGPWSATGTLRGDTLAIEYNLIMSLSDFEDAVYIRKR